MSDLKRYTAACNYSSILDERVVNRHLAAYVATLGQKQKVIRLRSGWVLEDNPSILRNIDWILDYIKKRDPKFFSDASNAIVASDARVARDASVASVASVARDASVASVASVARDAIVASVARVE